MASSLLNTSSQIYGLGGATAEPSGVALNTQLDDIATMISVVQLARHLNNADIIVPSLVTSTLLFTLSGSIDTWSDRHSRRVPAEL